MAPPQRNQHPPRAVVIMLMTVIWPVLAPHAHAVEPIQFNRDVRPILSRSCFPCHGPDEQSREAGFRLDVRESATAVGASGATPVVPTNLKTSELIRRIESSDALERMPPIPHMSLSTREKLLLKQWIAEGAKYQRHWAFEMPERTSPPPVRNDAWTRNAIDHFILARLERARLAPSPEANRATLIRRVTLDLTGLPATPAEMDEFFHDTRADAYERVVDRLLASPAYAERRTQDWLDLARYADTRGFADDNMRQIWPYRDWVIRAIASNMPFDRFTVEQLAGDMLPGPTSAQRLATAFHRNAPQAKGQTYPVEEYRVQGVIDRVNTTGRVWLGLTLGCAECHDHKFDPVSQRDYYSLFAIFNNIEHGGSGFKQGGPTMQWRRAPSSPDGRRAAERARIRAALAEVLARLPKFQPANKDHLLGVWDAPSVAENADDYSPTGDLTITATIRTTQPVADIVSKYDWQGKQRSFVFGIGGEGDKNGVPGHLFFWVSSQTDPFRGAEVYGSFPVADGNEHEVAVVFEAGKSIRLFVDGVEDKAARIKGAVPSSIARSNRRLTVGAGYRNSPDAKAFRFHNGLRRVRLFDQAIGDQIDLGARGAEVSRLRASLHALNPKASKAPQSHLDVPVMRERSEPRKTFVHVRGNFLNRGEQVFPAPPMELLEDTQERSWNRLDFARWLVDGRNPLVARVVVNRYWQTYFGRGLVSTPDDFGAQGSLPTHPRLLDWLAIEFASSGWDMKRLHRLVVTSATYRQSARLTQILQQRDPRNELLSRMPRIRLPAETIRDQALAMGGLLVRNIGGPPVFPIQPDGYWKQRALPGEWKVSRGEDRFRRTLYTYWRRMALHPSLELLNAPAREACVAQRDVSNVPTQALVMLNDPVFSEAAAALAARLFREAKGDDTFRLELAFRIVLGRQPEVDERTRFLAFLSRQRADLASDPESTRMLASWTAPKSPDLLDRAAWTLACSVLLNLDEVITRP